MDHSNLDTPDSQANCDNSAAIMTFPHRDAVARVPVPASGVIGPAFAAALQSHLPQWGRSPDIYAVVFEVFAAQGTPAAQTEPAIPSADVLMLAWQIECMPKPVVALLDGPIAHPVIGMTSFVTHRVAAENYRMQLPPADDRAATPAGGIAHTLGRVPAGRGREWALTGRAIGRAEAYAAGLITHCIPRSAFPAIIAALAEGRPVDPLLDGLHRDPAPDDDVPDDGATARCFAAGGITEISAALARETGRNVKWAQAAAQALVGQSSFALAGLLRLLDVSRTLDRRESLIQSHRLACGLAVARDVRQATATAAAIENLFAVPDDGDISLAQRAEIANGRF